MPVVWPIIIVLLPPTLHGQVISEPHRGEGVDDLPVSKHVLSGGIRELRRIALRVKGYSSPITLAKVSSKLNFLCLEASNNFNLTKGHSSRQYEC